MHNYVKPGAWLANWFVCVKTCVGWTTFLLDCLQCNLVCKIGSYNSMGVSDILYPVAWFIACSHVDLDICVYNRSIHSH